MRYLPAQLEMATAIACEMQRHYNKVEHFHIARTILIRECAEKCVAASFDTATLALDEREATKLLLHAAILNRRGEGPRLTRTEVQ
jgi:hypothetical protein